MFSCQDGCSQHVEKPVHLGLRFFPVLPDRMMQSGGKLDGELMGGWRHECLGDLRGTWKRIRCHSAAAQFVTKGWQVSIGIVFGQQCNRLLRSIRWRFPENW